jgi:hypothetical protein
MVNETIQYSSLFDAWQESVARKAGGDPPKLTNTMKQELKAHFATILEGLSPQPFSSYI